jgi:hypothetical protein
MAITNSLLSSTAKTVVFNPIGENAVTCMILCNTSLTTDTEVNVWVVPAGQATSDKHLVINSLLLTKGETFSMDTERFILADSDSVQAQATQDVIVAMTVSYVQTAG